MDDARRSLLTALEKALGYRFGDPARLDEALTHRSFVNENPALGARDNERLEFLGDAVLELTVRDLLMRRFPAASEGELSKLRASVVNEQPLADLARQFGLGELLRLGRGEEATGGRHKPSLLANAFESVVAALYLDGGFDRTAAVVAALIRPLLDAGGPVLYRDYKTAVQELCRRRFGVFPHYTLLGESGPDHEKRFEAGLMVGTRCLAAGEGRSKKEAEQAAAQRALSRLREEIDEDVTDP